MGQRVRGSWLPTTFYANHLSQQAVEEPFWERPATIIDGGSRLGIVTAGETSAACRYHPNSSLVAIDFIRTRGKRGIHPEQGI